MANSIGGVSFRLTIGNAAPAPQAEVLQMTREGIDGIGLKVLGLRGGPVTWQCISFHNDSSAAETQIAAIQNLQGKLTSAVDNWGVSTDVFVETAEIVSKQQTILGGSGDRVQVVASVRMRRVNP